MNQPNTAGQGDNVQPPANSGHPAWQEYLNDIPPALHGVVQSAFQKWDTNVKTRLQEVHAQYAPLKAYQPLADNNITLDYVGQALQFAQELEKNPKDMVTRMNQQLNLGFVPADQVQTQQNEYDPFADDTDITSHPQFKQMQEVITQMQSKFDEQQQQSQAEREAEEFYEYLDTLTENTPFKDNDDVKTLITAFMSQGMDGPQALQKVQANFVQSLASSAEQNLNNNEQPNVTANPLMDAINATIPPVAATPVGHNPQDEGQAPVVMGNSGNAGSGVPNATVDFGKMSTNDINAIVAQTLANTDNG
jgi:hypothetical protein